MKKRIRQVVLGILLVLLLAIAGFGVLYAGRLRTVNSIEQLTNYDDYNLYRMDICYDYSIDDVINYGITDNQSMIDAILKEALPLLPVKMKAPQFGCSAFGTVLDRHIVMGRNYDFKRDTSAMLVYCAPKNGYKSVALTALDNISANEPDANLKKKLACLTAPFICLDGMNEKGVSIEAEVGSIGGEEDGVVGMGECADPDECKRVADLGVDMLAAGIGNIHGKYPANWKGLSFETLDAIQQKTGVMPLVLHGGTGIPADMIKKAISLGVAKINVNTECQLSFADATRKYIEAGKDLEGKGFDPRKLLAPGAEAIKATVKEKMELFGSVGKAND